MTFVGLTWDHPRGYDALAEAARRANQGRDTPLIEWKKQPLEGFESAPIADLAARHDLLVLDHPHIGEAVASDCLIPLEELYPETTLARWRADSVGPSFSSYQCEGQSWAVPLDVASQVMARRPDIVAEPPATWPEVVDLASTRGVAMSIGGPHAVLTLMSIAAGQGDEVGGDRFVSDEAGGAGLSLMHRLYRARPKGSETLNPIRLLETMAGDDTIALVPLIFGYVTYVRPDHDRRPLAFSDSIGAAAGGTLGGTGIGFSRRATPSQPLLDHVASLMATDTQKHLFPQFGGQPSARAAWTDPVINAEWGGFYKNTLRSAETAFLRPRFNGYIAFQTQASERIRVALQEGETETRTLSALRALWTAARDRARHNRDQIGVQQ